MTLKMFACVLAQVKINAYHFYRFLNVYNFILQLGEI